MLSRSVAALLRQELDLEYEVIVVNDDTEPLRCTLPHDPRLRILTSGSAGIAVARNVGVRASAAPIIAFTDDDTVAPPSWLNSICKRLAEHPEVLGVEGPVEYGRSVDPLFEHVPKPELPGAFCSCNVAYRRDAVIAVGLFDERFRVPGGEDLDLGLRVNALGCVMFAPEMVMVHPPRPMSAVAIMMRGRQLKNDWLLFENHPQLCERRPRRFGGIAPRFRRFAAYARDPGVTHGSWARIARALALGVGTAVIAAAAACTRPMSRPAGW